MDFKIRIAFTKEENGKETIIPISKEVRNVSGKEEAVKSISETFKGFSFDNNEDSSKYSIKVLRVENIPELSPQNDFNYYDFYKHYLENIADRIMDHGRKVYDLFYQSNAYDLTINKHKYRLIPSSSDDNLKLEGLVLKGTNVEICYFAPLGMISVVSKGPFGNKDDLVATFYKHKKGFGEDVLEISHDGTRFIPSSKEDKSIESMFNNQYGISNFQNRKVFMEELLKDFSINKEQIDALKEDELSKLNTPFNNMHERIVLKYNGEEASKEKTPEKVISRDEE